mmetsp:Transcript_16015/g.29987  ORF Transcript_16015/g.29987 Transcript_16015/m.29987 type:complete len:587 (+) Transcript_16015:165-1925(+)|eukprot:CAMPEP_0182505880 /NCGR_PEP_ID=MMETSP1321-20130603/20093_1 /TAXON_ID=91990 /ORGANISM="Bolidomonas sp., Strain RCC1657" /LENGTH=586 /DNA_ID=CAMNT_0024711503 /DNA_START=115 /DNA_END=1875 /DNA_ORIENTATION=-
MCQPKAKGAEAASEDKNPPNRSMGPRGSMSRRLSIDTVQQLQLKKPYQVAIRQYLFQTLTLSILSMALGFPLLYIYADNYDLIGSRVYGKPFPELQITRPSIYSSPEELRNITVTPTATWDRDAYFQDTGLEYPDFDSGPRENTSKGLRYLYITCSLLTNAARGWFVFRPNRTGTVLLCALTLFAIYVSALCIEHMTHQWRLHGNSSDEVMAENASYRMGIFGVSFSYFSLPYLLCFKFSPADREVKCSTFKLFCVMLAFGVFEFVIYLMFQQYLLVAYFSSGTSLFAKMIIRMVGQMVFLPLTIEAVTSLSDFLQNECGVEMRDTFCILVPVITLTTFLARVMQGSAESIIEMVFLEVVGTLCEFSMADGLLRGLSPIDATRSYLGMKTKAEKMRLLKVEPAASDKSQMASEDKGPALTVKRKMSVATKIETSRQVFCAGVLIMIAVAEAAAIFSSSLFFYALQINPAEPGSKALSDGTVIKNFVVMLFGEFVLTDAVLAVASHFLHRYRNDVAAQWAYFNERRGFITAMVVLMNMMTCMLIVWVPLTLCLTSRADENIQDWVLTQCPAMPTNITDMSQVGYSWV